MKQVKFFENNKYQTVVVDFVNLRITNFLDEDLYLVSKFKHLNISDIIEQELETYLNVIEDAKQKCELWKDYYDGFKPFAQQVGLQAALSASGTKLFIAEVESEYVYEIVASVILDKYFPYVKGSTQELKNRIDYDQLLEDYRDRQPNFIAN